MDKRKPYVIFKYKPIKSINNIIAYISGKGYPETAEKFADKLYNFGYSLANVPSRYPICRHPQLAKRKMRCAIFHKTYIFVYKEVKKSIVIYNIIHGSMNPASFSA